MDQVVATDITRQLKQYKKRVDAAISKYFDDSGNGFNIGLTQPQQELFDKLKEFNMRPSKRVRGVLAMVSYEMLGGKKEETAGLLAAAIEFVQDYLLIVDDVMDRSVKRRDGETIHLQYQHEFESQLGGEEAVHLGQMLGVNAGLLALHTASRIVAGLPEEPARVAKASELLHTNIQLTVHGQVEDLLNNRHADFDEERIINLQQLKSGYYTIINPIQMGCVLAGGDGVLLDAVKQFGEPAGIAFQMYDDIIGLFGDEAKTGKPNIDDLREGKMTIPIHRALQEANTAERKIIRSALGNSKLTQDEAERVREIVKKTDSLRYSLDMIQRYTNKALESIKDTSFPDQYRDFLSQLIAKTVNRGI